MTDKSAKRLTAAEARAIAGATLDEKVDAILTRIAEFAQDKKRQLKCGWDYDYDKDLWINGGYSKSKDWIAAHKILTDLGYKVSFYYSESQFVDMYTLIEW